MSLISCQLLPLLNVAVILVALYLKMICRVRRYLTLWTHQEWKQYLRRLRPALSWIIPKEKHTKLTLHYLKMCYTWCINHHFNVHKHGEMIFDIISPPHKFNPKTWLTKVSFSWLTPRFSFCPQPQQTHPGPGAEMFVRYEDGEWSGQVNSPGYPHFPSLSSEPFPPCKPCLEENPFVLQAPPDGATHCRLLTSRFLCHQIRRQKAGRPLGVPS